MPQLYRFDDPNEDTHMKQFFASFGLTDSIKKSIEEGTPWGLYYWPTMQDRKEMVFEYHKRMNPSTFIINIKAIYRVLDTRDKTERLYWYGSKQVRTPPPAETLPGREFPVEGYFERHVKPIVKFEGMDYYGKPVGVQLTDTEAVYDLEWSKDHFEELISNPFSKFSHYDLYVGNASAGATRGPPSPMYLIKDVDDFVNGSIDELLELGANTFDSLDQYKATKELQEKERQAWVQSNSDFNSSRIMKQQQPQQPLKK